MSKRLAVYDSSTGEILGRVFLADDDQVVNYPSRLELTQAEFESDPETYKRVSAGALVNKTTVTVTPSKTPFDADGVDECVLTFAGLIDDASPRVNGVLTSITVSDPTITITADTPAVFVVRLVDAYHVSDEIEVSAV